MFDFWKKILELFIVFRKINSGNDGLQEVIAPFLFSQNPIALLQQP